MSCKTNMPSIYIPHPQLQRLAGHRGVPGVGAAGDLPQLPHRGQVQRFHRRLHGKSQSLGGGRASRGVQVFRLRSVDQARALDRVRPGYRRSRRPARAGGEDEALPPNRRMVLVQTGAGLVGTPGE